MTNREKMEHLIETCGSLIEKSVESDTPEFIRWKSETVRLLTRQYGEKSVELKDYENILFHPLVYVSRSAYENKLVSIQACKKGLEISKELLSSYLSDMDEEQPHKKEEKTTNNTIFIVHGHDGELKEAVARLIMKQGFKEIILNEQANRGKTIIEKLEHYGDAKAAICLFTADDGGKAKSEAEINKRARQNVVFEAGYFVGRLGRDRVIIIADEGVEIPSDLGGVVRSNRQNWELDVLKDLYAMGFEVNLQALLG